MVRISVITAVYNGEKHLEETILSVLSQGYDNLEYIIVDGGSTDNSLKIIDRYRDGIDTVISEPDNGISDAFNKGLKLAAGELIGIVSSDDYLLPGSLEAINRAYQHNNGASVYYGSHISLDCARHKSFRVLPAALNAMHYGMAIGHPPAFVSSSCYREYGLFDLQYKYAMDYELMLRFYIKGAFFERVNRDLVVVRMGGTNQRNRKKALIEVKNISLKYGGNLFAVYLELFKKRFKDLLGQNLSDSHLLNLCREHLGRTKKIEFDWIK